MVQTYDGQTQAYWKANGVSVGDVKICDQKQLPYRYSTCATYGNRFRAEKRASGVGSWHKSHAEESEKVRLGGTPPRKVREQARAQQQLPGAPEGVRRGPRHSRVDDAEDSILALAMTNPTIIDMAADPRNAAAAIADLHEPCRRGTLLGL